jgi:hypothetical protein
MSSSASYLETRGFKAFQLSILLSGLSVSRTHLAILSLASWRCELLRGILSSRFPRKAPFRPSFIRPPKGPNPYPRSPGCLPERTPNPPSCLPPHAIGDTAGQKAG